MIGNIKFQVKRFNSNIKKYKLKFIFTYIDFLIVFIIHGVSFKGYFAYRFFEKNWRKKKTFITYKRSKKIIMKYNNVKSVEFLLNKNKFNIKFNNYIKRDWVLIDWQFKDEITKFLGSHSEFFLKPFDGSCGRNTEIIKSRDISTFELLDKYNGFLIEQVIKQHNTLMDLNPSSVNTVRVLTAKNNLDEVEIIAAALRMGKKGNIVDNIHNGGICAQVDVDTGIVFTKAINTNYETYIFHPDTNTQVIGLLIPYWDMVKKTVINCAKEIQDINYVGWDFAITNDGCDLIEANHDPDHNLIQMADQEGKFKTLIKALKKK